jgi:hypothetical protein
MDNNTSNMPGPVESVPNNDSGSSPSTLEVVLGSFALVPRTSSRNNCNRKLLFDGRVLRLKLELELSTEQNQLIETKWIRDWVVAR